MKNILLLFCLIIPLVSIGQEEIWSREMSDISFMSQLDDGKLLMKDKSKIYLVNHKTGKLEFEYAIKNSNNPEMLEKLPIFFIEGKKFVIIDYATAHIIEESTQKTTVLGITYFLEKRRVIVEMKRNDQLQVLNINLKDITTSWSTSIGKVRKKVFDPLTRISEFPPFISKDGKLVIYDQKSVSILHPNGKLLKRLSLKNKIKSHYFNDKKGVVYVLDSKKKLHFVDTKSETNSFIPLKDDDIDLHILGDGSKISIKQGKNVWLVNSTNGTLIGKSGFIYPVRMLYVDEETGKLYALTRRQLAEIDQNTVEVIRHVSFEKDIKEIRKVYAKTVINGSSWASPFNLETFRLEYPQLPDIPAIHDYVDLDNGTGYIFEEDDRFEFHVVDKSGNVVWDEKFNSAISPSLDVINQGILFINDSRVKYLSVETGESLWPDKVKVDNSFTYGVDEETKDLYMYSKKRLFRFDHSTGALSKSEDEFRFRDFDYEFQVPQLFILPDAIFMKGSNSIFVLNKDGTIRHKKFYKRISNTSTILELANVVVIAVAIGTGNIDEISVFNTGDGVYVGSLVDPLDMSASIAADMRFDRREKQNRGSNIYPYVFTKLEVGKRGFIFLDPSTGEERFSIKIVSKNPNYIVDDYDGILFHLREKELKAYDLK